MIEGEKMKQFMEDNKGHCNQLLFATNKPMMSVKVSILWLYFCALCLFVLTTLFPFITKAQDIKVYDENYNLKNRVEGDRIYDKDWNLRYRIKDDKVYDKDWNLRYRIEEDKIYDKDWNLRYRKEDNNIYDRDYRRRYRLKTED